MVATLSAPRTHQSIGVSFSFEFTTKSNMKQQQQQQPNNNNNI
jgi:hypothetical protein